jgi:hypothetical protein
VAGLHAYGTWCGGEFLGDPGSLVGLAARVHGSSFAAILEGRFDQRPIAPKARVYTERELTDE